MSMPGVMTANVTKFRQIQSIDKSNKRKDTYKSKTRKDGVTDLLIGDNFDASNPYESTIKEGKEVLRPSTAGRESTKEVVRPSTAGRNKNQAIEQSNNLKENCPLNGDLCKRCSTPGDHKPIEKLDEGFYDDEQNHKMSVIEDVKELIRKNDVKNGETTDDIENEFINERLSCCNKPKKSIWLAVVVWVFTFTGALAFYFALFVYSYKYEPFYSTALEFLGWKEELPPPPPTMKEEIFQMLQQITNKMYSIHSSLMQIVSVPFKNKS